jgi:hypothetical protein
MDEQRKAGALAKGGGDQRSKHRAKKSPVIPSLAAARVDKHLADRGRERRAARHRLRWRARVKQSFMSLAPRHRARKGTPKADRRRALELLASCHDDCTEAVMLAHGFTVDQVVELVRAGLASATPERVRAGNKAMEIARVRITEAGRRLINGASS